MAIENQTRREIQDWLKDQPEAYREQMRELLNDEIKKVKR
jgi:hypothetical protein